MKAQTYRLLVEALRRFECFSVRRDDTQWTMDDIQKAWTGSGTYTVYKSALEEGYMTYVHTPHPGYCQWWKLTEKGAQVILDWHNQGYGCEGTYQVTQQPPIPQPAALATI